MSDEEITALVASWGWEPLKGKKRLEPLGDEVFEPLGFETVALSKTVIGEGLVAPIPAEVESRDRVIWRPLRMESPAGTMFIACPAPENLEAEVTDPEWLLGYLKTSLRPDPEVLEYLGVLRFLTHAGLPLAGSAALRLSGERGLNLQAFIATLNQEWERAESLLEGLGEEMARYNLARLKIRRRRFKEAADLLAEVQFEDAQVLVRQLGSRRGRQLLAVEPETGFDQRVERQRNRLMARSWNEPDPFLRSLVMAAEGRSEEALEQLSDWVSKEGSRLSIPLQDVEPYVQLAANTLRRTWDDQALSFLAGLFMTLVKARHFELASRLGPDWGGNAGWRERLRYLCRVCRLYSAPTLNEVVAEGFRIYPGQRRVLDGQLPLAVLVLELSLFDTEQGGPVVCLLSRAYRELGMRTAAQSVLWAQVSKPLSERETNLEFACIELELGDAEEGAAKLAELKTYGDYEAFVWLRYLVWSGQLDDQDWKLFDRLHGYPPGRLVLAAAHESVGDWETALRWCDEEPEVHPVWPDRAILKIRLLKQMGEFEKAEEVVRKELARRPNHVRLVATVVEFFQEQKIECSAFIRRLHLLRPDLDDPLTVLQRPEPFDGPGFTNWWCR